MHEPNISQRPQTTVVLAISADGKISDQWRSHPQFGSANDYAHLEQQVAAADGVLFGAATLRAGGSAMRVLQPELIASRVEAGKPPQPVQIVCSRIGKFDPQLTFFRQPVPRWLVTSQLEQAYPGFDQVLAFTVNGEIDWRSAFKQMFDLGVKQLAVLGGGELISSLLHLDLIDELWLTVCPILLGGATAPTPIGGEGFLESAAPRLQLLEVKPVDQEVFLHYRVQPQS